MLPGLAAVLYGGYGLLTAGSRVPLGSWLTWFVGSALLHDLVIAPVWIGLGWLAARFLPAAARPAVVVGTAVAGVLTLVALPFLLGFGADPGNPSFLPRDYGRNLLLVDAGVLVVAAAVGHGGDPPRAAACRLTPGPCFGAGAGRRHSDPGAVVSSPSHDQCGIATPGGTSAPSAEYASTSPTAHSM